MVQKNILNYLTNNRFTTCLTKLKKVSYALIIAEFLDFVTTFIAIRYFGESEFNPLGFNFQANFIRVSFVFLMVYVLEHEKYFKFMWAVPIVMGFAPLWNVYVIILSITGG